MNKRYTFTILTPTHNRAHLLPRLYLSIKKQTYKDFIWIIVNDGSNDDTDTIVQSFIDEKAVAILYYKQSALGKPYALRKGFELNCSDYIVDIDDDDELTQDCLAVYKKEWDKIEELHKDKIGSIRALTIDENGKIVGDDNSILNHPPFESNYLETHISMNKQWENLTCYKTSMFDSSVIFKFDEYWNGHKIKFVSERVFWSRLARVSQTRYIFKPLRVYHYSNESISRILGAKNKSQLVCLIYSFLLMYNENSEYILINKKNLKEFIVFLVYIKQAGLKKLKVISELKPLKVKIILYLLLPLSFLANIFYNIKYTKSN